MARRWRPADGAMGTGRGSDLGLSAAYAQGTRTMFLQRYAADLRRVMDREDMQPDVRWFDSHCHLDAWNIWSNCLWLGDVRCGIKRGFLHDVN